MAHRLYLTVRALSPDAPGDVGALRRALTASFPGPVNEAYLRELESASPAVTLTRLTALSLLPPLLEEAGIPPAAVRLSRDVAGRPSLTLPEKAEPADFNLSHSAGHVACALWTGHGRVGVDIEEPIPADRAIKLSERFFSPGEQVMLLHLAREIGIPSAFAAVWTAKEAISKQDGRGGPLGFDASTPPLGITLQRVFPDSTGAVLTVCWPGDGTSLE